MRNKINIGIIGKNFGYHVIYKSFLKNKKYKIIGFAFKSKKLNKILIHKNIKIYPSWKKMILDKNIDAIAVAVPPILHKKIISLAIKKNKHIFCEKPLTPSYKEANYLCDLVRKNKKITHMVNFEFADIGAFSFFKKKIINNIKIKKINLNWFIRSKRRPVTSWKENHSKGGGIIFNYICHSIYYLEYMFGKIISVRTNIILNNNQVNILNGILFFKNGLSVKLDIKVGSISKNINPTHQIKIVAEKNIYILKTNLNSLSDKFELLSFKNNLNEKGKILFEEKKNKNDFRIKPTLNNSRRFSNWILKEKKQNPNFFDAERIHWIIDKIIISSRKKREISIY
jgi:predicted dehydrogenase